MPRSSHVRLCSTAALLMGAVLSIGLQVLGADIVWDGNGASPPNGLFTVPANWDLDRVPGTSDNAVFNLDDIYTVTLDNRVNNLALKVFAGDVTLTSTSTWPQSQAPITVDGGALTLDAVTSIGRFGPTIVGLAGTGSLDIRNRANVSVQNDFTIGQDSGSGGTVTVHGSGSILSVGTSAIIGERGTGSLTVSDGGKVETYGIRLGNQAGAQGTLMVDGPGSAFEDSWDIYVGGSWGSGSLTIQNGGQVTGKQRIRIGRMDGPGTAVVRGAGSTLKGSIFGITVGGLGTMLISEGGLVTGSMGWIGAQNRGLAQATIDGPGSQWISTENFCIGESGGAGSLLITNGGNATDKFGYINLHNHWDGALSTVTIDGLGSTWITSDTLYLPRYNQGILNVRNGGSVSSSSAYMGEKAGSDGTVTIDGLGSIWTNTNTITVGVEGQAILKAINGGVVKSKEVNVTAKGTIGGNSTIQAHVVNSGGLIAPGSSAGTLTIDGNLTMSAGILEIEIGGLLAGSEYDQLLTTGQADFSGGTLQIDLIDDFVPRYGDSFTILSFAGRTSEFQQLNGLDLGNGLRFEPIYTDTSLVLKTVPEPCAVVSLAGLVVVGLIARLWRQHS